MRVRSNTDDAFLDGQRVAIHAGGSAVAHNANHAGVAAVIHRGIQAALVNQPLFVGFLADVVGFDALGRDHFRRRSRSAKIERFPVGRGGADSRVAAPTHAGAHAPFRGPLQGDSDIHRPAGRRGEQLNHDIVGPGSKRLAHPVAMLVGPVTLISPLSKSSVRR